MYTGRAFALVCTLLCLCLLFAPALAQPGEIILTADDLYAEAAILIDADTGEVLFEKHADRAMFPASTTKIMTCLLALEAGGVDENIVVPKEVKDAPKGSSLMPCQAGEEMQLLDLLYGLMLPSGNDAANAIAVLHSGSIEAFVARMNERAAELSMTNTHYANAHGFHDDSHYTTARDMATLARYAMQNTTFREIVSTRGYIVEPNNKRTERLKISNSNLMLFPGSDHYCAYVTGIKTGFTNAAGQTFVFAAERDGAHLIGVVLKTADKKDDTRRWKDAQALIDYGFARYRAFSFAELYGMAPASVQVENAIDSDPAGGLLTLTAANISGNYVVSCLDEDSTQALENFHSCCTLSISADPVAPIAAGTILGTLTLTAPDGQTASATLVASRSVDARPQVPQLSDYLPFLAGIDLSGAWLVLKIAGGTLLGFWILRGVIRSRQEARRRARRRSARRNAAKTTYRNSSNRSGRPY